METCKIFPKLGKKNTSGVWLDMAEIPFFDPEMTTTYCSFWRRSQNESFLPYVASASIQLKIREICGMCLATGNPY
jgi:hypothetical protein